MDRQRRMVAAKRLHGESRAAATVGELDRWSAAPTRDRTGILTHFDRRESPQSAFLPRFEVIKPDRGWTIVPRLWPRLLPASWPASFLYSGLPRACAGAAAGREGEIRFLAPGTAEAVSAAGCCRRGDVLALRRVDRTGRTVRPGAR